MAKKKAPSKKTPKVRDLEIKGPKGGMNKGELIEALKGPGTPLRYANQEVSY